MLMNGKEVNHLIIGGQQFDKSYFGKHLKIKSDNIYTNRHLDSNGNIFVTRESGTLIEIGEECICLAKCKDNLFIIPLAKSPTGDYRDTWVKDSDVSIL